MVAMPRRPNSTARSVPTPHKSVTGRASALALGDWMTGADTALHDTGGPHGLQRETNRSSNFKHGDLRSAIEPHIQMKPSDARVYIERARSRLEQSHVVLAHVERDYQRPVKRQPHLA